MISKINEALLILSSWIELSVLTKGTIILVLGLTLAWLFRNARASVRHLVLVATFAALLLLPLVVLIAPEMTVDVPVKYRDNSATEVSAVSRSENLTSNTGDKYLALRTPKSGDWSAISLVTIVRLGWAAGVFLLFMSLFISLWQLERLRRNGLPWLAMHDYIKSLASECGIRRKVEILLHEDIKTPLTCGIRHPAILLPSDARQWSETDLRRALIHELEHVRRGDWFIQLAARAIYAIYWFHPLVWIAWRRLCLEAERSCDDAVIQRAESTGYAEQLVLLAKRLSKQCALPTLGMANRSDLSIRLSAILDGRQRRGRAGLSAAACTAIVTGFLVLAIAPLRAVMRSPVTPALSGVNSEIKSDLPEDNSEVEIVTSHDRRRNSYKKRVNNGRTKRLGVRGKNSRSSNKREVQIKKLQAERNPGKLQPEKQRTGANATRAEAITDRQKKDAEQRERWAEMETKRAEAIIERQKKDAEWRKRLAKRQALKDEAIARRAGIIPR